MSVDVEKATTRSLLDGLRSYLIAPAEALSPMNREEQATLSESREHFAVTAHLGDVLPLLSQYSFVVLLTLIVEARLTVFCRGLEDEHGFSPGMDGLSGNLLDRARAFLSENLQLQPPTDLWLWLTDIARVRDCAVHSAGSLELLKSADRRDILVTAKRRPGLSIETDHALFDRAPRVLSRPERSLRVDRAFCLEAVTAAQGVFGYLYQHRDPEP